MKKKSLLTMVASLALVGAMGVGATLAYFSDSTEEVTNSFTFVEDGIDIDIWEHEINDDTKELGTELVKENTYTRIVPGMTVPKDPFVEVSEQSADCYVFVEVQNDNDGVVSSIAFDEENWTLVRNGDNGTSYWRYNEVVKYGDAGEVDTNADRDGIQLESVFTSVTFSSEVTENENDVVPTIKDIIVRAAAVQASAYESVDDAYTAAYTLFVPGEE